MKLEMGQLEQVAGLFRALAEPGRLAMVQELKEGELGVSEIVARVQTSQANVSKQLKLLHEAGLLDRRKVGNQVRYRISDPMVLELCALVCGKLNRDVRKSAALEF